MIVLAITTSTDNGSIALVSEKKILAQKSWARKKQHSENLTPFLDHLFKKAKIKPSKIDVIAVDRGPGSFTGCRIAVNVARTFAYALGKPLFAAHSLDIMAFAATEKFDGTIACLLDAHKSLFYFRNFPNGAPIKALSIEELSLQLREKMLVLGNFSKPVALLLKKKKVRFTKGALNFPQAKYLARMCLEQPLGAQNWPKVEPAYIRSPDVVEKLFPINNT